MDHETRSVWPCDDLEVRRSGRTIFGSFRYGAVATMRDRGRTRKESFAPKSLSYAVDDMEREINLLLGHDFDSPLASRKAGSLVVEDTPERLMFRAELPDPVDQTVAQLDAVKQISQGLARGVSPGFRIPPKDVVPNAEELVPEPGNPAVMIRVIRAAVLYELSIVTRPAYEDGTEVDVRSMRAEGPPEPRYWL